MPNDAFVELCTCVDGLTAHSVRAALEARGIPVVIQGGQTHDMLGPIAAPYMQPRVLVHPEDLSTAKVIAEDIVGRLDDHPDPESPPDRVDDPMRPIPSEFASEDDDLDDLDEDDADEDRDGDIEATPPKPKRYGVPLLLAFLGLGLGLSHIYAGRGTIGGVLLLMALLGITLSISGQILGLFIVAVVWSVDLVGGLMAVARHNQALGRPS